MLKAKEPAELSLELWVYCPYCEEYQEVPWSDYFERDELLKIKKGLNILQKCDNEDCGKEFEIDKTVW
ncbi:MAG: hypothetical protein GY793_09050 [Proteobacteria bacterium]|nr:hypothetical protein [Pseudomonadota bacterium]